MSPTLETPRRVLLHATILAGVVGGASLPPTVLQAQDTESPLSPAGRLRLDVTPSVMLWDSRFGLRTEGGSLLEGSEPLGVDLRDPEGYRIFPGVSNLRPTLRELVGDPGLPVPLGASRAEVSAERIRLPFRLDFGVLDWLTVGVTVPIEKNRTEVTHALPADSSQVGVTPAITRPAAVTAFLTDLERALSDLRDLGGSPDLEDELSAFLDGLAGLYGTASLFPADGTAAGTALDNRLAALDSALQDAGVSGVEAQLPLATAAVTGPDGVAELLTGPDFGYRTGLEDLPGVWELGDVEVQAVVGLLRGAVRDSANAPARIRWEVGVGGLVRLATGTTSDPDLVLDLGSGDGQTDIEGRFFANASMGRLGLWADARYGTQGSTTLVRRVAPPDRVLVPLSGRRIVEWTPGRYVRFDLAPRLHLTPELALMAGYRYASKAEDEYAEVNGPPDRPPGFGGYVGPTWDASVLSLETEWTTHELGGGMIFSTLESWREGRASLPLEVRFTVRRTVSGRGGRTPEALTAQLGVRLYRRIWGG